MRSLLFHIMALLILVVGIELYAEAQATYSCDQQAFGPYCVNPHTNPMDGYLPIGTIISFRDVAYSPSESLRTDYGLIDGYYWHYPTQSYEYLVITNPIDPEAQLPFMRRALVFRSEVIDAIN